MRNISTASLAKLATRTGTEPVCILEIEWQRGHPVRYADKAIDGMQGRILTIDTIEDVINVSKSGTSQSVNVMLDDSDGALKRIFNSVDIHKKKVKVYQWFTGIPLSDRILLFVGVIASPVTWKEGDRTLSFSVISQSEDHEVGFSPEEGSFPNLPQGIIGTAWPLVFGTVQKLPCILIDNIAHSDSQSVNKGGDGAASVTKDGTGIKDPSLDKRIDDNEKNAGAAAQLAQLYFVGYLLASFTARRRGELGEFDSIEKGKGRFSGLAKQYLQQGNAKLKEAQKIRSKNTDLKSVRSTQDQNEKKSIGVTNGSLFPQGKSATLNLNGALHTGIFLGDNFIIETREHPAAQQYSGMHIDDVADRQGDPVIPRQNFFWADGGIPLKLGIVAGSTSTTPAEPFLPVRYIVAATIQVTVNALWAYRTVGGVKYFVTVPSNYFQIFQVHFGTLPVTLVYMEQPLSSRNSEAGESEGWDDDVYASCTSPIGPNTVGILKWLIDTYTGRTYDAASFDAVASAIDPFPMHFALTDRPNVLKLIGDIAYQSRCIVWLKNDVFFIKYLSKAEAPVDVISRDDILEQSMEVSYTETEDLVTKYVAHWRPDYKISKNFAVIFRYNVAYYGLLEKEYSFFCYNMQSLVQKSAMFWLIREANTFKKIKITVPISKLNIETLDTVTLSLGSTYIANGPIDCVVEEAKLNTADYTVELLLWVPVRAGEMTKYLFAYMGDLQIGYYFPTAEDVQTGRAGSGNDVPFNNDVTLPEPGPAGSPDYTKPFSGDPGNGGTTQTTDRPQTHGNDPTEQSDLNALAPEILTRLDATAITSAGKRPDGTTKYQYDQQSVKNTFTPENPPPRTYPGKIQNRNGTGANGFAAYSVSIYQNGFGGEAKVIDKVVFCGPKDQELNMGDGVLVSEVFSYGENGSVTVEYYMAGNSGGSGRVFPGKVTGGTGTTYNVDLYRHGVDNEPEPISAIQLQIDNSETIPPDTWVLVNEIMIPSGNDFTSNYYIQVPVWL